MTSQGGRSTFSHSFESSKNTNATELEYAKARMQQKWHDLVMAEQQGATEQVLERMFNSYMVSVEEYNRYQEQLALNVPLVVKSEPITKSGHSKKAS